MHSELKQCANIKSKIAPDLLVRLASGIISEPPILEHMQENRTLCETPNFVRTNEPDVDRVYSSREILSIPTAVLSRLCYTTPFNNRIFMVHKYFLRIPVSATPIQLLPVNKSLGNFRRI